jgi:hypothetical protein
MRWIARKIKVEWLCVDRVEWWRAWDGTSEEILNRVGEFEKGMWGGVRKREEMEGSSASC